MDMSEKVIDIGIALVVLAIIVGGVAIATLETVNISSLTTTQALVWGLPLTFGLLAVGLMFIRSVKKKGR